MENRQICVVIPVYNARKYLSLAINSVREQSYIYWSLVLVNDGSTDGSDKICDHFASIDSRIKVIHQENGGSVEARKAGVLSETAQNASYITFLDSDDILSTDALEVMARYAYDNNLDCVCASSVRIWKQFRFQRLQTNSATDLKIYTNKEIIEQIYISCFGVTDYPITLWGKLYATSLITDAITQDAVVRFMGDDLSLTIQILPRTQRLGIIPNIIYSYRIGGNTSKYLPEMLDEFLALYRFKSMMCQRYPIPQDAEYYMAVEMLNILNSWLRMFRLQGKHSHQQLIEEIQRVSRLSEIEHSISILNERGKTMPLKELLEECKCLEIAADIEKQIRRDYPKQLIKKIVYSI